MQHAGADDIAHVFAPKGATQITVVDILAHAATLYNLFLDFFII